MKTLKIIILIFCLVLISCQNDKSTKKMINADLEDFKKSKYFKADRILIDKYKVKYYGDVSAYSELSVYYSYNKSKKEEFLPYILLMVEKHKRYKYCTVAFNHFLEFYTEKEPEYDGTEKSLIFFLKNLEKLNTSQKQYLLYFLELGAANNDFGSLNLLELLNREGIGMKKNNIKADSLKNVIKNLNKKYS